MTVELDGDRELALQTRDELLGVVRRQQGRHVLDAQRVGAHLDEPAGDLDVVIERVHRRDRVDDRRLKVLACLLDRRRRGLEVARVVQGIEDAEDVDAVLGRLGHEAPHDVVAVVPVADQVLTAQQHLERRAVHVVAYDAQAFPGVFV